MSHFSIDSISWPDSFSFPWVRYGAPYNTEFKITVENLSSRASWQVRFSLSSLFKILWMFHDA